MTQASAPPPERTAPATNATTQRPPRRRARTTTTATTPQTTSTATTTTPATTTSTTTTATTTTPKAPSHPGTAIDETAQLQLVSKQSATEYTQSGTVTGTYNGTMVLTAKITNAGVVVNFTVSAANGTVVGHGLAILHITGADLEPITGTASITGGTGHFNGVHAGGLKVAGRVALDASRGTVHLTGTMFFP